MPGTSFSHCRLALSLGLAIALGACHKPGDPTLQPEPEGTGVGYGKQPQKEVTGSVSAIDGDEARRTTATSMADMIEGRFPGVDVKRLPGGALSIRIRGSRSLTRSSEPLYVIDGIPKGDGSNGVIQDLDPRDIKRIEVLKDAAATSVYGSRGANGVILITTIRGGR